MARYCSDCSYLDPDKPKSKGGKGCYKCSKKGKFMLPNMPACDKFCNAYARKNYDKERLYDEGKELSDNSSTNSNPLALLVLFIVLLIIAFIANYKK